MLCFFTKNLRKPQVLRIFARKNRFSDASYALYLRPRGHLVKNTRFSPSKNAKNFDKICALRKGFSSKNIPKQKGTPRPRDALLFESSVVILPRLFHQDFLAVNDIYTCRQVHSLCAQIYAADAVDTLARYACLYTLDRCWVDAFQDIALRCYVGVLAQLP